MAGGIGRFAFGIVGAFIGSYFGPLGASLGYMAGSLIGGLVFPESGPTVEGSRLEDTSVSSSANGAPIPLGFGTMRMPIHIIDATDIVEERVEQDIGGKGGMGGSGGTQITYRYFANLFCSAGEPLHQSISGGSAVGVLKWFADGKVAFDNGPTSFTLGEAFTHVWRKGQNENGFKLRFYPGDEAQLPDPFFEAIHGVGNVSAYRGEVCVALEHWALEDYGNRIPIMTAIVAFKGNETDVVRNETSFASRATTQQECVGVNWDYAVAYTAQNADGSISQIDLTTLTEVHRGPDVTAYGRPDGEGDIVRIFVAPLSGLIAGQMESVGPGFGTNATVAVSINPETLQCNGRLGKSSADVLVNLPTIGDPFGNIGAQGGGAAINDAYNVDNTLTTFFLICNGEELFICKVTPDYYPPNPQTPSVGHCEWVWGGGASDGLGKKNFGGEGDYSAACAGRIYVGACEFLLATKYINGTYPGTLYLVTVQSGGLYRIANGDFSGVFITEVPNAEATLGLTASTEYVQTIMFDRTDQMHVLMLGREVTADVRFIKVDSVLGDVAWDTGWLTDRDVPGSYLNDWRVSLPMSRLASETICLSSGTGFVYDLNLVTGEVGPIHAAPAGWACTGVAYDSITRSILGASTFVNGTRQLFCGRLVGLGDTLKNINEYLADRIGFDINNPDDINYTALSGITVPGGIVSRQQVAQSVVRQWSQAYNYEIIESDHKAKATLLDKAVAATIPQVDLIRTNDNNGTIVTEQRVEDFEIPARVNIEYADNSLDYLPGLQREQRLLYPNPSVRSRTETKIQLPLAMSASEAREIAERLLYRGWVERRSISFKTGWKYIYLDPGDIVDVTVGNATYRVRILEMAVGANNEIEFSAVSHATTVYTPSEVPATTDSGDGWANTLPVAGVTHMAFLDKAPLLRDSDNTFTTIPLYYGCWSSPGFINSTIYKQEPAGSWEAIDRCVREIVRGHTNDALASPPVGAFFVDDASSVTIQLIEGDDSKIVTQTDTQWRNNGLVLLIGSEVVGVKTVVDNGDNTYTLSNLFRGMLGTEWAIGSHVEGETWYLLDSAYMMLVQEKVDSLSIPELWKAVADGQSFDLAPPVSHTTTGVTLMPYAPAELSAVNSGSNINISCAPRSRLTSNLRDGIDGYSESEQSESYEFDIVASGSVVRTLTSVDGTATYSIGAQTADFGGGAGDITINAYKLNNLVGRGYAASIEHTGSGGGSSVAPTIVGTVTERAVYNTVAEYETFNVTPSAGSGTTMLVLGIAYGRSASIVDDFRFLDMQGGSSVQFAGQDMQHVPRFAQIYTTSAGTHVGMMDMFYLLNPGTDLGAVEIIWPGGITPQSFVAFAFVVQDVNPNVPLGTARAHNGVDLADFDSPPTWPTGTTQRQWNDEGTIAVQWQKDTDNPTLGLMLQCQHDPRKLAAFRAGPFMSAVDFASSTGTTTANTAAVGYRLGSIPLVGDAGSIITGYYNTQEYSITAPRESADIFIEVNGI